jgi:catechol 2,3-dioxygenase-like lactoylglutathione lyase family enzyme
MLPLSQAKVTTILPVKDLQRARAFYEGKLGFSNPTAKPDGALQYDLAHSSVALLPKEGGTKAEHTALSFEVSDIVDGIRTLEKAGVTFEEYDFPGLKTVEHVCDMGGEKCAWFRDTEGNYLCLHQPAR